VKTLLRKGADVNEQDRDGHTALMFAVINIHTDIVRALLDYGADVNARTNDGCTPLILAACGGDTGIVQALLNKGADVKGKLEATGKTALMLAAEHGYITIAELIEQAGANQ
jgi:ankyrin repeat protein